MINTYLQRYTSNTLAGSSNQYYFEMQKGEVKTGRVFYKIFCGGEYDYSFLFSNVIDSTYADGSKSCRNFLCGEWQILGARVCVAKIVAPNKASFELILSENDTSDIVFSKFHTLTFGGKPQKKVKVGETFCTDGLRMAVDKDEYLCVEITFSGLQIPYHEETQLPLFVKNGDKWDYSREMPVPNMVGCDRTVERKIAFLGDSITQGIGVRDNSYKHWNALLAEKIGDSYAYWNLGIGYARASDASTDGAWLYKVKQCDDVLICLGVNDLCQGATAIQIKKDLQIIVRKLKEVGKRVWLQTVPPFNYNERVRKEWLEVNRFITQELSKEVELVFDVVPVLGVDEQTPHMAKYGGHPNEEGCALWAERLYEALSGAGVIKSI